ncbi:MAG: 6-bladed beta-propeller, partial [bacterium]|nr:6-bladed beta-propeller [bacterium]
MKYLKHLTLFIVIISLAVFLCGEPNKLLELYKKGTIKLTGDPEFGKNVDWERFFYDKYKEFIVASDGTMFVANSRQHNLMKFSKEGKLLNTFSQKGKGPGDVVYPGDMSILDNKYLVVGEYASNRRISLFDLNALSASKRCKVLKTKHSAYFAVALKNNKVAYMSYKYSNENQKEKTITTSVYIIDAKTQNTKRVVSHRFPNKSGIIVGRMMVSFGGGLLGEVYIASTKNGNLLVGGSVYPELTVYSTEGKKLKTIPLDMKPVT